MELKDKVLKDFWIWYLLPEQRKTYKTDSLRGNDSVVKIRFLAMSFTERYSVYVDFFDSIGITVWVAPNGDWLYYIEEHDTEIEYSERFYSRPQARIAAIEKANEICN
jgi:hypothetical protein|tara:strand:- start:1854 stop:2177 length:324 start_codon:yes stop_codon:yes gene_type:complete